MVYSFKSLLTQDPTKVTAAIMSVVNVLVISNAIGWDENTLGAVNTALVLVLALFYVGPLTASKQELGELKAAETDAFLVGAEMGERSVITNNFVSSAQVEEIVGQQVAAQVQGAVAVESAKMRAESEMAAKAEKAAARPRKASKRSR